MEYAQVAARNGTPLTGCPAASQRAALADLRNGFAYGVDALHVSGRPNGL